jgi:hypothetical protein
MTISEMARQSPATLMADAARMFAGPLGYWMIVAAAILSTLSALAANVMAASRIALSMARDRTLPHVMEHQHATRGTPVMAIYTSALALVCILLILPDVAAAGAAASLIFLVSFALVHWMSFLARRRAQHVGPFQTPWFPAVQVVGGVACAALAVFQAFAVPSAGAIAAIWLGLGVLLYVALFSGRARAVDAFAEAADPNLSMMRGRSPLVLVPVANPASAAGMVAIANALTPPVVGRVVLLSVIRAPDRGKAGSGEAVGTLAKPIVDAQAVVGAALSRSFETGHTPEALLTIASDPWKEIVRVAQTRQCESLLLGLPTVASEGSVEPVERLLNEVECDVVVLRAPIGWQLSSKSRIVVPVGGRGGHDALRARLLGSLGRAGYRAVRFVRIVPSKTTPEERKRLEKELARFAREETHGKPDAQVVASDSVVEALAGVADEGDLLVLGLQRHRGRRLFGEVALQVARTTRAATILISRRG